MKKTCLVENKRHRKGLGHSDSFDAWVLMLPMVIILYLFVWRPTVLGAYWSLFKMNAYNVGAFCGLDNFKKVVTHTQFLPMLWNTVQYVFWSLIIGFLPPYAFALMLNEIQHGKGIFRVLMYIPVVIPGIAAMLMWYFMYYPDNTGLLNMVLCKLGMEPYRWLNDSRFVIPGIIIYMTWKNYGGGVILYFASLQSVSTEVYEAALIDGAGPWGRFWNVTRPATEGILLLQLIRQIISVFQIMQEPLAMTGGGPNGASTSLSYQLYQYGFNSAGKGTGQAMALGVIIFLILIVFTLFYFWLNKKVEDRY